MLTREKKSSFPELNPGSKRRAPGQQRRYGDPFRRKLIAAVMALRDHGEPPPGAENPLVYRTRSGSVFLPKTADWIAATEHLREVFVEHPALDPEPKALAS